MNNNSILPPVEWADDRQGWTAPPNGRGTISIIWSCAVTTFLCCWAVLINNLPEPGSSRLSIIIRKFLLLGLCALAPEAIFQVALGQWLSARTSVKLFHESGFRDWTLRHGFYVDMGGLQLRSPDYPPFPINSEQLHYLISKRYVAYPQIEESQIRDRNKVDGMLRFITLVQTMFFIVNVILRAAQHLAITALELSTAAFVFSSVLTTVFWLEKPADVQKCEFIYTEKSISTIRLNAGVAADVVYTYTPLDFVGREEWPWSILWMHGLNCLRRLHLAGQPQQLPIQRFQNTVVPVIKSWFLVLFATLSLIYFAIFIAGWNVIFPTNIERTLWRAASITAMVTATGCFLTQQIFFVWYPALRRIQDEVHQSPETISRSQVHGSRVAVLIREVKIKFDAMIALLRNNSISNNPALDAPPGAVVITWILGFFYVSARAYIVITDFMELRSLPASAYETLNLSSLAPYIP